MTTYKKFLLSAICCAVTSVSHAAPTNSALNLNTDTYSSAIITPSQSSHIAANFITLHGENGQPEWQNYHQLIQDEVRDANGTLRAYEVAVYNDKDDPMGYVVVPVTEGFGVVSSFNFKGESRKQQLEALFETKWKKIITDNGFDANNAFYVGGENGFIGVAIEVGSGYDDVIKNADYINGYYIFTDHPFQNVNETLFKDPNAIKTLGHSIISTMDLSTITKQVRTQKEQGLRQRLIDGSINGTNNSVSSRMTTATEDTDGALLLDSSEINYEFAPYNQEQGNWGHDRGQGECYTGCTPVAFGILLQYWDQHGYRYMVGGADNEQHLDHTQAVPREMLDNIAMVLETRCTDGNQGGSKYYQTPRVLEYIKSKGYFSTWEAFFTFGLSSANASAWSELKSEVKEARPIVAAVAVNGAERPNHSVVVYSYQDFQEDGLDAYCFSTGWGGSTMCQNRSTHFGTTVVRPTKLWWRR